MVLSRHHSWGRVRSRYMPWGFDEPVVIREVNRYPAYPNRGNSRDSMMIGGAVALGVVAVAAIIFGATRK